MRARSLAVALAAALAVLAAHVAPLAAQHEHGAPATRPPAPRRAAAADPAALGDIRFPNSGGRAAQRPFLLGVAMLHNFEYGEAAAAFRDAERADPAFALPYWL